MNDLAAGPKPSLALAQFVLTSAVFDAGDALREFGGSDLQATRDKLHQQLLRLRDDETTLNGPQSKEIRRALTIVGTAVAPTMAPDQCSAWLNAVLVKLSDLPSRCVCQAAGEAVHTSFRFIAEVEPFVRNRGEALQAQQRQALARLDAMQRELLERQRPRITDRWKGEPITDGQVHEWQRSSLGRTIVRMGLAAGFIEPQQLSEPLPPEEGRNGND